MPRLHKSKITNPFHAIQDRGLHNPNYMKYPDLEEGYSRWKGRTLKGFDVDLRSQLFHDEERESVVERYWTHCVAGLENEEPILFRFESEEREKIGPLSIQQPWSDRVSTAEFYWKRRRWSPKFDALNRALNDVRSLAPASGIIPLSVDSAVEGLPKRKFSGLPFFKTFVSPPHDYISRAAAARKGDYIHILPAVLGWRGQAHGPAKSDTSQRVLWMMDKLDAIISARYLYPLLDVLRKREEFVAWNDLGVVDAVVRSAIGRNNNVEDIYSSDFSSFDASIGTYLIEEVFSIISSWFDVVESDLEVLKRGFIGCDLLVPDEIWQGRNGGVPSGSGFTNLVDTLVNIIAAKYVGYALGVEHKFGTYLGDDSVNIWGTSPDSIEVSEALADLGLTAHADKQFISKTHVHYLQNVYSAEMHGTRPVMRFLQGALSYERLKDPKKWSHSMASVRTLMQLENCKNHPRFANLVSLTKQGDVYLSQYRANALFTMAGGPSKVDEALGRDVFQYTSWGTRKPSKLAVAYFLGY